MDEYKLKVVGVHYAANPDGKGAATDVIEASARAYLNAVNRNITFNTLGISGN